MEQKHTDKDKASSKKKQGGCCGCGQNRNPEEEKLEKLKYEVAQEMGLEEE